MSAYMVGKNHIAFLIAAANRCQPRSYGLFKWRHDGKWHQLDRHTEERVAQMLMDANLESVSTRYPNTVRKRQEARDQQRICTESDADRQRWRHLSRGVR